MWRHIVDDKHRQMLLVPDGAQLVQQPGPVGFAHFFVTLGAGVPALVQRFSCHHLDLVAYLRDDLKTPVEHQLDAGKALVQGFDDAHQPPLLGLLVKAGGQAVGVECVQKKAPVSALPKRGNDTGGKKISPLGRCLVDDIGFPVAVARQLPVCGDVGVIRARSLHLGDRYVSVHVGSGQQRRVFSMVWLDDHHVERPEIRQRRTVAVI